MNELTKEEIDALARLAKRVESFGDDYFRSRSTATLNLTRAQITALKKVLHADKSK